MGPLIVRDCIDCQVYGIISCAVSFWTPASVMAVAYVRIYRVAKQQQQHIYSLTYSLPYHRRSAFSHIYSLAYSMGQCIANFDQVCSRRHFSPAPGNTPARNYSRRHMIHGWGRGQDLELLGLRLRVDWGQGFSAWDWGGVICPPPLGHFEIAGSVRLSVPWRSFLSYRHAGCL